jgi:hypothetical protein
LAPVAAEREQRAAAFVRFPVSLSAVLCCHRSMEVPSRRLRLLSAAEGTDAFEENRKK